HVDVRAGSGERNFGGEGHLENVAGFGALDETERTEGGETAHGLAGGSGADAEASGDARRWGGELGPTFEGRVADEEEIDRAVDDGKAQAVVENVRELDDEKLEVEFCFHGQILKWNGGRSGWWLVAGEHQANSRFLRLRPRGSAT